MTNFFRLIRFAWPYRLRFGMSLGCAIMVAILWGANISAVYPLLNILFYSQNCQNWVSEKITATETEQREIAVRIAEVELVQNSQDREWLRQHFDNVEAQWRRVESETWTAERELQIQALDAARDRGGLRKPLSGVENPQRELAVARAQREELKKLVELIRTQEDNLPEALAKRHAALVKEAEKAQSHGEYYRWVQPWVNRYLPNDGFYTLVLLIVVVMFGVALKGVFMFMQEVLVASVTQLTLFNVRNHFFRRTMALDLSHFNDQGSAELMSRFTSDMDSLSQGLNTVMGKVIREPLRALSCLSVAFWLNWRLTLLALILVPISAITTRKVGKIMKRAVRRSLESISNIYKILQETFQGIKVVKAYTMEHRERMRFYRETKNLYRKSVKVATIDAMSDPVLEMLSLGTLSIALLSGSYLVLRQTMFLDLGFFSLQLSSHPMAIEDLLSLYAMLAGIADPVRKLANVHARIQRASAASDRICALMDREPRVREIERPTALPKLVKSIEFRDVCFSYNGRDPVITRLNLMIRHGERIALVGPNGCGKSTLMGLLPRFFDTESGMILLDGHDLRSLRIRDVRRRIGLVTQETILFEDTIANNIRYGTGNASREDVETAARRSYAHQFIMNLPQGYDTMLLERGANLSGGQRQRLALARVMLRDPDILILDEATSAIDIEDETLIRKAIEQFSQGRTTFVIAHHLGAIKLADRIVLMNGGKIEAVGTDAELRKSSALYRRLNEIHYQRESA